GFFLASRFYPEIDALAIRGISDLIDNKNDGDEKSSQKLAASHASAFAFELLAKIDVVDLQQKKYGMDTVNGLAIRTNRLNQTLKVNDFIDACGDKYDSKKSVPCQKDFLRMMSYCVGRMEEL